MDTPIKLKYLNTQREKMSPLVRNYWAELEQANEKGQPVAYVMGTFPQEFLSAIDAQVFFAENFGAACAVAKSSQQLCEVVEAKGWPMEVCSYARTNLGALATGHNPMGRKLPKPDLIAYCSFKCQAYPGWAKATKEMFPDAPVISIDVPPFTDGMSADEYGEAQRYVTQQLRDTIKFLDGWRGRRFDEDVLAQAVHNTGKGAQAMVGLIDTMRVKPSPLSLIDIFVQLFPMVCLRGSPLVAEYYDAARTEVEQRIAEGYGAVPDEQFRIYWEGIAIWSRLTPQFQQLARHKAALVAAAYAYDLPQASSRYDGSRPLESIAEYLMGNYVNLSLGTKIDYVSRMVKDFGVNGIIMQVSRSCKPFFVDEYALMKGVIERTGIPYCEVHGDMADPRLYSVREIEDRIETFLTGLVKG